MEIKQSTVGWLDVGWGDDVTNLGITGITTGQIVVKIAKEGVAGTTTKTMTGADWIENANGWYQLKLSAGDTDTLGRCKAIIVYNSSQEGAFDYEVVANLESDTFARLGAPAGASHAADIAAVKTDTAAIKAKTDVPAVIAAQGDVTSARDSIKGSGLPDIAAMQSRLGVPTGASIAADVAAVATSVATKSSQSSVDAIAAQATALQTSVAALQAVLDSLDDNGLTRAVVLSRDGGGRPLTTRVYRWDTKTNYDANGSTGRIEYLVTASYHSSGHIDTFSKGKV